MKITSGYAQGMKLSIAEGQITRPTSEKVRQAVMNMLSGYLSEAFFYDLCAGTGAMGLEALSRGARGCLFMESNQKALRCLQTNVTELERRFQKQELTSPKISIVPQSILQLPKFSEPASIIWADPPYQESLAYLQKMSKPLREMSEDDALLVWEWDSATLPKGDQTLENLNGWEWLKHKSYGRTVISLWRKRS